MHCFTTLIALICIFVSLSSAAITLQTNFDDFSGTGSGSGLDDCRALYNSRINECTDNRDFGDNYCRQPCQQALRNMEARLNNFCKGVTAKPGTLLEGIFKNKLVELICRDGGAMGPQSSARLTTVTKPIATETARVTTTREEEGEDMTTTVKLTTSSLTTATLSPSPSAITTSTTNFPIVSSTPSPSSPTTPIPTMGWREKVKQEQACAILQGGGGSPFDNMIQFRPPTYDKDKQQRMRDCEGIANQKLLELEAKKSDSSRQTAKGVVSLVMGVGVGLALFA